MLTSAFTRGGAERRIAGTAAGLARRGYTVRIVAHRRKSESEIDFEGDLTSLGLDAQIAPPAPPAHPNRLSQQVEAELVQAELELPVWWMTGIARPYARAILEFQPALVHGWIDRFAILAGLVSCNLGVPRVVIGQTSTTPEKRDFADAALLRAGYRALASNETVSFVNVSRRCAIEHEEWLDLEPGTISTIYPSVMPHVVRQPPADEVAAYRAQFGIFPQERLVGTIMRFEEPKDHCLWLDTAREIAIRKPDVRFLMAGAGSLKASIEQRIDALGLRDQIILPGPAIDVGLIYAALDIFLATSRIEGLGNTLVEAQAAGRPVVTTDVGGTPEAVFQGVTGLVVEERSATGLADAVLKILDEPAWQGRAVVAGPDFVAQRFGYDRMVAETIALYERRRHGE